MSQSDRNLGRVEERKTMGLKNQAEMRQTMAEFDISVFNKEESKSVQNENSPAL